MKKNARITYLPESKEYSGTLLQEKPFEDTKVSDVLQNSIETLLLQSMSQLMQQYDLISHLSGGYKERVLQNLACLHHETEKILDEKPISS